MKKLRGKTVLTLMCIASILNPFFFYACRVTFLFINAATFNGLTSVIVALMLANTVLWLVLCARPKLSDRLLNLLTIAGAASNLVFAVVNIVFLITGANDFHIYYYYFTRSLPYLGTALLVYVTLWLLPELKLKARRALSVIVVICVLFSLVSAAFDFSAFEFTSSPVVFITDAPDTYSVVWSTSDRATGYIEYTYNNEAYKIYDSQSGNIRSDSKIHTVSVPREHLDGNEYTVGSQRVREHLGYGADLGKSLTSKSYTLRAYTQGSDFCALAFSDWHDQEGRAIATANAMQRQPDIFFIMGDPVNMLNRIEDIEEAVLFAAGEITRSSCPAVYVRGNHETRGEYASHLIEHIGLSSFYYTFSWGPLSAIVLDTAEDKPDDHPEYGGLAAFEPYENEQSEWLKNVSFDENAQYRLVLAHIPELPEIWNESIDTLGTDIMISGHKHVSEIIGANAERNYPLIIDGGKTDGDFRGTLLVFSQDTVSVSFYKRAGLVSEEKLSLVR